MIITNFINNNDCIPLTGLWLDNMEPATGTVYGELPNSGIDDVESAYQVANNAFINWSQTTVETRANLLLKLADLIEDNLELLAQAESRDSGKPITLARTVDIPRAAANFRFYAHAITQYSSKTHEHVGNASINFTLRKPLGVVGCISPWNLPLYLFSWKIAPAIAAGNCVIAKPSEVTPATAFLLGNLIKEAGFPAGVLNILHGKGDTCGEAIVEHPGIKAISFTGGTATGAAIAKVAAPMFKKLSLELGGKNPNVIFADCDYDKMLETTLRSSFSNQGQICLCGSRIFVESSIYDRFKTDFISRTKQLIIGNPEHENTQIGSIVSTGHRDKIESYLAFAKANPETYTILTGGNRVQVLGCEHGYFLEPTIIEVATNNCKLNQEEIFGPVVTIMPFETETEAIQLANNTVYGLSATLWTNNLDRSMRFAQTIECGILWVNTWMSRDLRTPFGGIKNSGIGREGGFEALDFFTEPRNICINFNQFE